MITDRSINLDLTFTRVGYVRLEARSAVGRCAQIAGFSFRCPRIVLTARPAVRDP